MSLIDLEVVDEHGRHYPTDDAHIDFTVTGPAVWRGGYNSGKTKSTNNLYLNTECGINRVAVRSTLEPGMVVIKATQDGLESAEVAIESNPVKVVDGLMEISARRLLPRSD